jgi:hypothetical protein
MFGKTARRSTLLSPLLAMLFASAVYSQTPPRITAPTESSSLVAIPESHLPLLRRAKDIGPLSDDQTLNRMVLMLKMGPEQQHALTALLDSQQTRGSESYHAWLTPAEFGQRFGPAPEDIARIVYKRRVWPGAGPEWGRFRPQNPARMVPSGFAG